MAKETTNALGGGSARSGHIALGRYTEKFTMYPIDLVEFARENDIELPSIETHRGQALCLMAQPDIRGTVFISTVDAGEFLTRIGMESRDPIQAFNKATGLARVSKRGYYCLKFPFAVDKVDIDKRKGAAISGDRDASINRVKDYWRKILVDVPNDEWQIGHLDPTIGDASEKNLAYQPPIQAKTRDRFKWDADFRKMWPTGKELVGKFDEYYTESEQKEILEALKKKFASP